MSDTLYKTFGDYIKAKRAEIRPSLSRSEMARRCGFTPQYAMDIERGNMIPTEDKIEQLVNVLELDERIAFKLANKLPTRIYEQVKKEYFGEE